MKRNRRQSRSHERQAVAKFKPLFDLCSSTWEKQSVLHWLTTASTPEILNTVYWLVKQGALSRTCAKMWGAKV